ncbi:MAG: hypothetical protein RLZZ135_2186 [Cyanobacteriota bacterium]
MLAYILAVFIGTGSVGLYIAAFFFPELHRKQDFIWSGVGCFYALTLWIYAHEVTGGILVGQIASVALIGWFAWQILKLRRQLIPVERQTPIPNPTQLQTKLGSNKSRNVAAGEANSTTVKQIEPKASSDRSTNPNSTSSAIHLKRAQTAIAKQRANSVEIDVSQHQQSAPLPKVVIEPTGENDNEAWIKLEVKTSPAKSPESQPPQSITSQPPTETTKPPSSPPAPPAIAKTDLPAQKDRLPASKAEPSAQNHLNHPIEVTPAKNDPIDGTPIKSNLEDEAN